MNNILNIKSPLPLTVLLGISRRNNRASNLIAKTIWVMRCGRFHWHGRNAVTELLEAVDIPSGFTSEAKGCCL